MWLALILLAPQNVTTALLFTAEYHQGKLMVHRYSIAGSKLLESGRIELAYPQLKGPSLSLSPNGLALAADFPSNEVLGQRRIFLTSVARFPAHSTFVTPQPYLRTWWISDSRFALGSYPGGPLHYEVRNARGKVVEEGKKLVKEKPDPRIERAFPKLLDAIHEASVGLSPSPSSPFDFNSSWAAVSHGQMVFSDDYRVCHFGGAPVADMWKSFLYVAELKQGKWRVRKVCEAAPWPRLFVGKDYVALLEGSKEGKWVTILKRKDYRKIGIVRAEDAVLIP